MVKDFRPDKSEFKVEIKAMAMAMAEVGVEVDKPMEEGQFDIVVVRRED
jgi:hypothetical protein